MRVDTGRFGLSKGEAAKRPFLASMGIYVFNTRVLKKVLEADTDKTDFGKEIMPSILESYRVHAHGFDGYWADIGTVRSFYDANLELAQPLPRFNLFDQDNPIYTNARFLPGAKVNQASVENSILCDGVIVDRSTVRDSILGVRSRVHPGATIQDSYVMGADYYGTGPTRGGSKYALGIGEGCYIRGAIIDKNARIGRGVQLVNRQSHDHYDHPEGRVHVREGVIVVPKGTVLPNNFVF
jgi:glucose-1-phosphate adenylyltransferase